MVVPTSSAAATSLSSLSLLVLPLSAELLALEGLTNIKNPNKTKKRTTKPKQISNKKPKLKSHIYGGGGYMTLEDVRWELLTET